MLALVLVVAFLFLRLLSCAIDIVRAVSCKRFDQCQNAEEALLAAYRLDMLGNWEEAMKAYRLSAERWPEHRRYIDQCIEGIKRKQSGTRPVD